MSSPTPDEVQTRQLLTKEQADWERRLGRRMPRIIYIAGWAWGHAPPSCKKQLATETSILKKERLSSGRDRFSIRKMIPSGESWSPEVVRPNPLLSTRSINPQRKRRRGQDLQADTKKADYTWNQLQAKAQNRRHWLAAYIPGGMTGISK